MGLRQGDPLSPLLFNIYIHGLTDELLRDCPETVRKKIPFFTTCICPNLCFADDVLLLAFNRLAMEFLIGRLQTFFKNLDLFINETKSAVVILTGRVALEDKAAYKGITCDIPWQPEYVYLGLNIGGSFANYGNNLSDAILDI